MGHTHTFLDGFCGRYHVYSMSLYLCQCKPFKMRTSTSKLESPAAKEGEHTSCKCTLKFAGQRRTRNTWGTSTRLEGLVSAVVFFVGLFVHGLSGPSSQHLILVLASILITQRVTWSLLCLLCSTECLLSLIFLSRFPKCLMGQDGHRCPGCGWGMLCSGPPH